ncbi:hypothetical protein IWX46DRAFT_35240 [Phyllosticta citricarpa]|uniref:Uncharacterized protein n=1 Tax=Phyllosticta citricarpa TaxID=55181 RepID=A0ABR1MG76_9PEZI
MSFHAVEANLRPAPLRSWKLPHLKPTVSASRVRCDENAREETEWGVKTWPRKSETTCCCTRRRCTARSRQVSCLASRIEAMMRVREGDEGSLATADAAREGATRNKRNGTLQLVVGREVDQRNRRADERRARIATCRIDQWWTHPLAKPPSRSQHVTPLPVLCVQNCPRPVPSPGYAHVYALHHKSCATWPWKRRLVLHCVFLCGHPLTSYRALHYCCCRRRLFRVNRFPVVGAPICVLSLT